jgi:phosphoserine phosphatase RsbU/P
VALDAPRLRILRFFLGIWVTAVAAAILVKATGLTHEPFLGMSERTLTVGFVEDGGPAAAAGLKVGDRILSVNGREVDGLIGLTFPLRSVRPGGAVDLTVRRGGPPFAVTLVPERLPPAEMAWSLAQAVASLIALFVGSLVLMRRVGVLTFVFFLICLALSLLLFFPYVPPVPIAWAAANVGKILLTSLVPSLFVHFFLLFPYQRQTLRKHPALTRLLYVPSLVFFSLSIAPAFNIWPSEIRDTLRAVSEDLPVAGFAAAFAGSAILFARAYRKTDLASVRRKVRVALWGTMAGVLPIAVLLVYYSVYPGHPVPVDRLAVLALVLLPVGFAYAIVKHGVFDIELIVKRSLVITGVTGVLVLLYFLSYFLLRALLHTVTDLSGTLVSVVAFLFVIILFSPIRGHLQDLVDRSVYPERFASRRRLREFARNLPRLLGEDEIIRSSLQNVAVSLGIERGAYFPGTDPAVGASFAWGTPSRDQKPMLLGSCMRDPVLRRGEPMLREEVEAEIPYGYLPPEEGATLSRIDACVLAPIATGGHRFGVAVLGRRIDGDSYSAGDLEILDFVATQTALAMENAQFQRDLRNKEAMERELMVAQTLQRQLLPHASPDVPGIELTAATLPCQEVGGDYFDYVVTESGRVCLAVGDVSGKGIPAAILMANVQALFRAEARDAAEPDQVLDRMNRRLCEIERPDRFVSFFCGLYDPVRGELRYSSAGHPPPFLVRADGAVHRLDAAALLLGIERNVRYPLGVVRLQQGDIVLCFTDGIPDPLAQGSPMREDQLEEMIRTLRHLPADRLLDRLLDRLRHGPALDDDTTVLILKSV